MKNNTVAFTGCLCFAQFDNEPIILIDYFKERLIMKKIYLTTLLALMTLAACNQKTEQQPVLPKQTPPEIQTSTPTETKTEVATENVPAEYADFAALTAAVKQKLTNASPEQANQIYAEHRKAVGVELENLMKKEDNFLGNEYHNEKNWHYSENESEPSQPIGELKQRMDKLALVQLEYWDSGEGVVYIREKPDYFKNLFAGKVTPDVAEWIELSAHDVKEAVEVDASVVVPWAELGKRAVVWETFVKKYPDSPYVNEAKDNFKKYADMFLFGMDNSPVEYSTDPDLKDLMQEYEKIDQSWSEFAKKYPDSQIVPMLDEARRISKIQSKQGEDRFTEIEKFRRERLGITAR